MFLRVGPYFPGISMFLERKGRKSRGFLAQMTENMKCLSVFLQYNSFTEVHDVIMLTGLEKLHKATCLNICLL